MATRRTVEKAPDGAEKITTKQTMLQGRPGSSTPLWPLHWPVILGEGLKFENSELDPVGIETPCTWHDDRSAFFGRFTMDNLFHVMHHAIPSHAFMEAVLPAVAERATVDALPCPYFWNKRDVYHMWSWRLFVAGLGLPADRRLAELGTLLTASAAELPGAVAAARTLPAELPTKLAAKRGVAL